MYTPAAMTETPKKKANNRYLRKGYASTIHTPIRCRMPKMNLPEFYGDSFI
jgi:hypothetical protein